MEEEEENQVTHIVAEKVTKDIVEVVTGIVTAIVLIGEDMACGDRPCIPTEDTTALSSVRCRRNRIDRMVVTIMEMAILAFSLIFNIKYEV